MEHRELIRRMVLREICDDYENVDQTILSAIARDGAQHGVTVDRSEIVEALRELIASGLAKAYVLSGHPPYATELAGMPDIDKAEEDYRTYFWATHKGIEFHRAAHSWWPFEDDDEVAILT